MLKYILILLMLALPCLAAIYYVDQDGVYGTVGNDGSAGTSWGTAWLTIGKAISASVSAGDLVYIAAAKYRENSLDPTNSGASWQDAPRLIGLDKYTWVGDSLTVEKVRIMGSEPFGDSTWTKQSDLYWTTYFHATEPWNIYIAEVGLTKGANKAAVTGSDSTYFADTANDTLYIRLDGDTAPSEQDIEVANSAGAIMIFGANYWIFDNLIFEKSSNRGVYNPDDNVAYIRCIFMHNDVDGIYLNDVDTCFVYHCAFLENGNASGECGLDATGASSIVFTYNNIAYKNYNGFRLGTGTVNGNYNAAWENTVDFVNNWVKGANSLDAGDWSTTPAWWDYPIFLRPKGNSPLVDAGSAVHDSTGQMCGTVATPWMYSGDLNPFDDMGVFPARADYMSFMVSEGDIRKNTNR